jgi:hypothetical protein
MKSKRFSPVFVLITCVLLLATVSWGQNEGAIVQGQLVTGSGSGCQCTDTLLGVSVAFGNSVCTSFIPPSFTFSMSFSQYAIRVWVIGPKGTQALPLVR